jgi:hypothetical protein
MALELLPLSETRHSTKGQHFFNSTWIVPTFIEGVPIGVCYQFRYSHAQPPAPQGREPNRMLDEDKLNSASFTDCLA